MRWPPAGYANTQGTEQLLGKACDRLVSPGTPTASTTPRGSLPAESGSRLICTPPPPVGLSVSAAPAASTHTAGSATTAACAAATTAVAAAAADSRTAPCDQSDTPQSRTLSSHSRVVTKGVPRVSNTPQIFQI